MKWAWQAQFLSHALQIFKNCIFFADKQMILVLFCKISSNFELTKNLILCPIQFFSHLWFIPIFWTFFMDAFLQGHYIQNLTYALTALLVRTYKSVLILPKIECFEGQWILGCWIEIELMHHTEVTFLSTVIVWQRWCLIPMKWTYVWQLIF